MIEHYMCCYGALSALKFKSRKIGNSVGLVLPKEVLSWLIAGDVDAIDLTDSMGGGFRVTSTNPEVAHKLKLAQKSSVL